jgi:hypothetical protein
MWDYMGHMGYDMRDYIWGATWGTWGDMEGDMETWGMTWGTWGTSWGTWGTTWGHPGDLGVRLNSSTSLHPGSSPASHAELNHTLLKGYLEELKGHFSCVSSGIFKGIDTRV